MKELNFQEVTLVSGAKLDWDNINWWRAGFDVTGGAVLGTVLGGVYAVVNSDASGLLGGFAALLSMGIGGGIGMVVGAGAGAVFAVARETLSGE